MKPIVLSRMIFLKEMRAGRFTSYNLSIKPSGDINLISTNEEGSCFQLGSSTGQPRVWTNPSNPINFLKDCGVKSFTIQIEQDGE